MPTDAALADELVAAVSGFVQRDVLPVASELEHADAYPDDLVERMKAMGLFGVTIAPEHGGLGLDVGTYARIVEELAAGWMSLTGILNTHFICATLLSRHGTAEQQARLLPRLATGEVRGCLSLSEPDAGSDTRALRCKATPDADEYVVDGTKMWVTNGERAGLVALAARTPEGITCFMVEKEPGPRACSPGARPTGSTGESGPTSRRAWPSCSRRRPRSNWRRSRCASTADTATPPSCRSSVTTGTRR